MIGSSDQLRQVLQDISRGEGRVQGESGPGIGRWFRSGPDVISGDLFDLARSADIGYKPGCA